MVKSFDRPAIRIMSYLPGLNHLQANIGLAPHVKFCRIQYPHPDYTYSKCLCTLNNELIKLFSF